MDHLFWSLCAGSAVIFLMVIGLGLARAAGQWPDPPQYDQHPIPDLSAQSPRRRDELEEDKTA